MTGEENSSEKPPKARTRRRSPDVPPENVSLKPRGPGFVIAFLFLAIGVVFLVLPTSPDRRTLMIVVGVVNIFLGLAKLNRTIGPPRA